MPARISRDPSFRPLVSLRLSLFRRFGMLVTGAMLLFVLGYALFGIRAMVFHSAETRFTATADQVAAALKLLFDPAEKLLQMALSWSGPNAFSTDNPESFNHLFKPILEHSPQITSVVAGTSDGRGWMLLQQGDDRWHNRLTDLPDRGAQQQFFQWHGDLLQRQYVESTEYDPRRRPWYLGATDHSCVAAGRPHWTSPYSFFTTGDPGITVSGRRQLADGRQLVVGIDMTLLDISRATAAIAVGRQGFTLVMTDDGRVLGLPRSFAAKPVEVLRQTVLQPVSSLALVPLQTALKRWNKQTEMAPILRFQVGSHAWLGNFRPFRLDDQTFWIATLAPAADFTPPMSELYGALLVLFLLVLGLTLLEAQRQSRRLSIPLEFLARDSERIARLDFADSYPPPTRLREIHQLAEAHAGMRATLRSYRQTVDIQAASLRDQIDVLQRTQQQLKDQEVRLQQALDEEQAILDNAVVGILFVKNRVIVHCNRRLGELFGCSPEALIGQSTAILYESPESYAETGTKAYDSLNRQGRFVHEIYFRRQDGSRFWASLSGQVLDPGAPQSGSVWIVADLTEQKRAQERLEYLGHHDPLTDLPNRLLLNDRLEHALHRAARENQQLAVLFIDLDHFKAINDSLGHHTGDLLLVEVARRLSQNLRAADTLARQGGDEFIILIERVSDHLDLAGTAQKLLDSLAAPFAVGEYRFEITLSIGISLYPDDGTDPTTLVRNADAAMYQAKDEGRNRYRFYAEELTRKARQRLEMERELREAIRQHQFEIHYQPQIEVESGRLLGAEALVRWRHPTQGLVLPANFIPLAEETGLIGAIGALVLEQSCRDWAELAQGAPARIAVNFSAKQLQSRELLETVREVLERTGLAAAALEIEITESFFLETEEAFTLLHRLGELGIALTLDDFGTGYSSLSYLKQLPFRKLKIDQSFVRDIGRHADGETLVRTIIGLSQSLGLEVLAEGVETREQVEFLLRADCPAMQGYFFAHPLPLEQFRDWLAQRSTSIS